MLLYNWIEKYITAGISCQESLLPPESNIHVENQDLWKYLDLIVTATQLPAPPCLLPMHAITPTLFLISLPHLHCWALHLWVCVANDRVQVETKKFRVKRVKNKLIQNICRFQLLNFNLQSNHFLTPAAMTLVCCNHLLLVSILPFASLYSVQSKPD